MKKIFALLAVAALAAVGCDDKKTTAKPPSTTGGTYDVTKTAHGEAHTAVTNTVFEHKATVTDTKTDVKTVTKPALPEKDKPKGDGK